MEKREILAYAITHAPPGVKGGPYMANLGDYDNAVDVLSKDTAARARPTEWGRSKAREWAQKARKMGIKTARVIRIVQKARLEVGAAKESAAFEAETWREVSAVEVLRELVAVLDRWNDDTLQIGRASCRERV